MLQEEWGRKGYAVLISGSIGLAALAISFLLVSAAGCGKTQTTDLAYGHSDQAPVVVHKETSAISPQYNPGAPMRAVCGDGTVITKEGPYTLTAAAFTGSWTNCSSHSSVRVSSN